MSMIVEAIWLRIGFHPNPSPTHRWYNRYPLTTTVVCSRSVTDMRVITFLSSDATCNRSILADPALPKTAIESSRKPDQTIPSADRFQYHARGRKGLVSLGRFLSAMLWLLRRESDWLWSHDFWANLNVWNRWIRRPSWQSSLPTLAPIMASSNIYHVTLLHSHGSLPSTTRPFPSHMWYWKQSALGLVGSGLRDQIICEID